MSSVQQVYNRMFAGDAVRVRFPSKKAFDSLRTALCKKNTLSVALEMTELSVCGTYDAATGIGTFKLDKPARAANVNQWEVIEDEPHDDAK